MLITWMKDFLIVITIAALVNTTLYLLEDQLSIIGTWEFLNIDDGDIILEGNQYDIIEFHRDYTFIHLKNDITYHGFFEKSDKELMLFYGDFESTYRIDIEKKIIIQYETGYTYKKITLFE